MEKPKRSISKLAPPADNEPTLNVTGKGAEPDFATKPIQLKVPISKHKEMKSYAAEQGITMREMLLEGYELLKSKRG
ncbi:hypothetical protein [Rouxiella badensis]|uniref:hypothetical protein n=1 Tax=Rouxiella badensis TaxID=1646377 RepID=UPI0017886DFD|nr:hypothetical protein [Rouxiella badensis]QOI58067.1 hypothetical protein H2866_23215 [Rouxiella badensis subsp. acadiensis]